MNDNKKQIQNKSVYLNESTIVLSILATVFVVSFTVALIVKGIKNSMKAIISDFVYFYPECQELLKNIKVRTINIYQLCEYLGIDDYKEKFPKAEFFDVTIKAIFDSDNKLVAYTILCNGQYAIEIVNKKYLNNRNFSLLLKVLLEYHINCNGRSFNEMKEIVKANRKNKMSKNKSENANLNLILKKENIIVPNMPSDEFDDITKQLNDCFHKVFMNMRNSSLYFVSYFYNITENELNFRNFNYENNRAKAYFEDNYVINLKSLANCATLKLKHVLVKVLSDDEETEKTVNYCIESVLEDAIEKDIPKLLPSGFKRDYKSTRDHIKYYNDEFPYIYAVLENHEYLTLYTTKKYALKYDSKRN